MKEKYYITTAIAYASAKPHIGNTYEIVLTDAIARYKRLRGYDVVFQTGTDEHGQKIEGKSLSAGVTPQEYVDNVAGVVKDIFDVMNTSYDRFVRTSNTDHKEKVSRIFRKLYDQGDIYKGYYEGLYCTPCESFYTETEAKDNDYKCPDCGRELVKTSEEAYFLKLSNYTDQLVKYYDEHPHFIEPESRKNEIINNFIKPGLQDLCVSRTSFKWGIPVDFDDKHVIYVWIDALSNYITFAGYDTENPSEEYKKEWPADLQIIGKDIIRFHAIYWPIILMALGEPLPKKIFAHPWMMFGEDKMSKSKGNIVYADDLVKEVGVDAVRYYMLHEMPFASDGTYTHDLLIERINSDLANVLGNLVNRTISMGKKYFDGKITNKNVNEAVDNELKEITLNALNKIDSAIDNVRLVEAVDSVFEIFKRSNKYIDETTPWILAKDENKKDRLETVLYNLLEAIRIGAIYLSPFLPDTAKEIKRQLNIEDTNEGMETFGYIKEYNLNDPKPIFERIKIED